MANAVIPRYFIDETSIPLGQALAIVREDVVYPGHPAIPGIPAGTIDEEWIPKVGAMGLVVIGRDRHIVTKPAELEAYRVNQIRAFWISGKKDLGNWETLDRVVRRWAEIERIVEGGGPGAWFYGIHQTVVTPIPMREGHKPRPDVIPRRPPPVVETSGQLRIPWKGPRRSR